MRALGSIHCVDILNRLRLTRGAVFDPLDILNIRDYHGTGARFFAPPEPLKQCLFQLSKIRRLVFTGGNQFLHHDGGMASGNNCDETGSRIDGILDCDDGIFHATPELPIGPRQHRETS